MKIEVSDNFIKEKNIFNDIKNLLMSNDFPYYCNTRVPGKGGASDFYFSHILYNNDQQRSNFFNIIVPPILDKLEFKKLYRAKVNCYTKEHKHIHTEMHTDLHCNNVPIKHTVALLSINNNNGYTFFENGDKVLSKENRLALFDGDLKHCSVAQTDEYLRLNIVIDLL